MFGIKTMVVVTQPCEYTKTTDLYTVKEQILGYTNYISIITYSEIQWRRQWQPTPVLLPEKSHEWRSLVGCSPWGH